MVQLHKVFLRVSAGSPKSSQLEKEDESVWVVKPLSFARLPVSLEICILNFLNWLSFDPNGVSRLVLVS